MRLPTPGRSSAGPPAACGRRAPRRPPRGGSAPSARAGPRPRPPRLAAPREALLVLAGAAHHGVRRAEVLLRLLAQGLDPAAQPLLGKVGVALLELHEPDAVGEPLLRRPGVVLLQLEELEAVLGQPGAPTLGE